MVGRERGSCPREALRNGILVGYRAPALESEPALNLGFAKYQLQVALCASVYLINEENSCTYFIKLFWPSDDRIHVLNLTSTMWESSHSIDHKYFGGGGH